MPVGLCRSTSFASYLNDNLPPATNNTRFLPPTPLPSHRLFAQIEKAPVASWTNIHTYPTYKETQQRTTPSSKRTGEMSKWVGHGFIPPTHITRCRCPDPTTRVPCFRHDGLVPSAHSPLRRRVSLRFRQDAFSARRRRHRQGSEQ